LAARPRLRAARGGGGGIEAAAAAAGRAAAAADAGSPAASLSLGAWSWSLVRRAAAAAVACRFEVSVMSKCVREREKLSMGQLYLPLSPHLGSHDALALGRDRARGRLVIIGRHR